MKEQQVKELERLYETATNASLIDNYIHIGESNIEPEELERRVHILQDHVQMTYNCEQFIFTFNDKRSSRIKNHNYYMQGSIHPRTYSRQALIYSYGKDCDLFHLMSILHETGHGIDFLKRDYAYKAGVSNEENLRKEVFAWLYGLRLGYLTGIVTKQEIESMFIRCSLCLATYFKYYKASTGYFIATIVELEKRIFE